MAIRTDGPRHDETDEGIGIMLVALLLRCCWDFRTELFVCSLLEASYWWCARVTSPGTAVVLVAGVVAVLLAFRPSRQFMADLFAKARWRRRITGAFREFDGRLRDRAPMVTRVRRVALDVFAVKVVLRAGTSPSDLEQAAERIAAALGVATVRVERDRNDAGRVTLDIVVRDPFGRGVIRCPWAGSERTSLWAPIELGVGENGSPMLLSLVERNLLVGGEPNGGKSNVLQVITAAAALDPEVTLWLFDPKRVELHRWQGVARAFCGQDTDAATILLDGLRREMEHRYEVLEASHRRKVEPGDGMGLHVIVIDELILYLTDPDKKVAQNFANVLRDLVARGRAAGIIVVVATQKPSADVVPSSLRDLIAYRLALRCATRDASDTILGSGWATEGYSAAEIDPAQRGVGFLLHEGGVPVRFRAYYLADDELDHLVDRAAEVRGR